MNDARRRLLFLMPAVLVAAAVGFWLLFPRPGPPQALRIGAILPMTGNLAYIGQADANAMTLFTEEEPDVAVLIEDSRSTAKDALSAANRLTGRDVRLFLCSVSFLANAVDPVLQRRASPGCR
jgi:ABC-type branched-subunit amino acid transport system substrate-binding protein